MNDIYCRAPGFCCVPLKNTDFFFFLSGQLTNVRLQPVSLEVNSHRHLCLVPVALGGLLAQEIRGQQWFVQSLCTECIARPPLFWLSSFQDFPLTFQFNHLVLFLLALHANKTPGFLSKFWVTPVWQGLGPAFWQKAVIIGNLPVVIPFFQRQTPLQHLPAWLLFAAFGQLLFIFCSDFVAVMCTRITSSPFHFFFELVCISCFFFSSSVFITFFPSQHPSSAPPRGSSFGAQSFTASSESNSHLHLSNQVQGHRERMRINYQWPCLNDHNGAFSSKQQSLDLQPFIQLRKYLLNVYKVWGSVKGLSDTLISKRVKYPCP